MKQKVNDEERQHNRLPTKKSKKSINGRSFIVNFHVNWGVNHFPQFKGYQKNQPSFIGEQEIEKIRSWEKQNIR